ncbi:MAG: hypothetical protein ACRDPK_13820 [Carbonactinosporaceae bacterium]
MRSHIVSLALGAAATSGFVMGSLVTGLDPAQLIWQDTEPAGATSPTTDGPGSHHRTHGAADATNAQPEGGRTSGTSGTSIVINGHHVRASHGDVWVSESGSTDGSSDDAVHRLVLDLGLADGDGVRVFGSTLVVGAADASAEGTEGTGDTEGK